MGMRLVRDLNEMCMRLAETCETCLRVLVQARIESVEEARELGLHEPSLEPLLIPRARGRAKREERLLGLSILQQLCRDRPERTLQVLQRETERHHRILNMGAVKRVEALACDPGRHHGEAAQTKKRAKYRG